MIVYNRQKKTNILDILQYVWMVIAILLILTVG